MYENWFPVPEQPKEEIPKGKLNIAQLEALLDKENTWDEDREIEILPNGEIRVLGGYKPSEVKPNQKPLTFRENLGGEYAIDSSSLV